MKVFYGILNSVAFADGVTVKMDASSLKAAVRKLALLHGSKVDLIRVHGLNELFERFHSVVNKSRQRPDSNRHCAECFSGPFSLLSLLLRELNVGTRLGTRLRWRCFLDIKGG
jgi:hypothetical protein